MSLCLSLCLSLESLYYRSLEVKKLRSNTKIILKEILTWREKKDISLYSLEGKLNLA